MAQFLNNINLTGNEVQNFVIQPLATAPTSLLKVGRKYFNSAEKREAVYDGSKWLLTAYMSDIESINTIANDVDTRLKAIEAYFSNTEDADNAINKWNEIVAFLDATEGDTLESILSGYAVKTRKISAGTGLTGGGDLSADRTISLATVGTAGTYFKTTVDAYGRVTSGSNPTTLAGFGITDSYTKAEVNDLIEEVTNKATAVSVSDLLTAGTKIATLTIDNTPHVIYAPTLSGGTAAATGKYVSGVTVNDHAITVTQADLPTSLASPFALTINNSSGAAQATYDGSEAVALTLTKAMVGLSNVENTKLSTWAGSTSITTLGTITSGTWNGTKIANAYLANSKVTIAGNDVALGGSLSAATLKTALGLTAADVGATKKYATAITKGTATEYTITHSLGTRDVVVMVYDPDTYEQVMVDVIMTTTTAVKIAFGSAPAANYRVVVIG